MQLTFNAALKRVSTDADGESVVQLSVPLEDLSTIAKLSEGAVNKLLHVTVETE